MTASDRTKPKAPTTKQVFAFQGAPGSYSHVASLMFVKERGQKLGFIPPGALANKDFVGFAPCKTLEGVFEQVGSGGSNFGVVPLANSSEGITTRVYELIMDYQVSFMADMYIPIHHQLLGVAGTTPQTVKTIVSHPVVLKQCKKFLSKLPGVKPQAFWDTSSAAFYIKKNNDTSIAAIAGSAAARAAKLQILVPNVEDFTQNETRFAIIAPIQLAMEHIDKDFPKNPIFSCSVELDPDQIDFTAFVNMTLGKLGVTVLNTVTVPVKDSPWVYRYIFDLKVRSNKQAQDVWALIREKATRSRILGIYETIGL